MKSYIIGIAGTKNAGKDTVASMINYIFGAGLTRANYREYMTFKDNYDKKFKDRIIHFADNLKDVMSIIYNIPREYFDDRKYKDEKYYCIDSNTFVDRPCEEDRIIDIKEINSFDLSYILNKTSGLRRLIKLRTLLQYFSTDICRRFLSDDIWIKSTINKAVDIAETRRICLIPDVRFGNEIKAIRNNSDSLYGGVILIKRNNTDNSKLASGDLNYIHSSEDIDFDCDFEINNDSTKFNLFYKVLDICKQIIK